MAKIRTIQIYRGTEAQNNAYTGSAGELTMDTTNNELRLHDGSTVGGHGISGNIKNKNTAAGATNPIYDWVGTLAEYTSQAVATNHPDWVCYITDDLTAQAYDAYSKSQSDTLLANKANIDLDNLSSAGQKVLDGQWVISGFSVVSGSTETTTHIQRSLSSYLPNDGYVYEVLFTIGNNNTSAVNVSSDLGTVGSVRGYPSSQILNTFTLVVGTGRYVETYTTSSSSSNTFVQAQAYRRVGTNS